MAKLLSISDNIALVPKGGNAGQVLRKASDTDRDTEWSAGVPDGGDLGEILIKNSDADGDAVWKNVFAPGRLCLRFDHTKAHCVNIGAFFPQGVADFGSCMYEAWVRPDSGAFTGYVFASGYGGAHPVLLGVAMDGDKGQVTGNMWIDGAAESFSSSPVEMNAETWNYIAVAWDGSFIYTFLNHVLVGKKAASGNRTAPNNSSNVMHIGGTHHTTNFGGFIRRIRAWEDGLPFEPGIVPGGAFLRDTADQTFRNVFLKNDHTLLHSVLLMDFTTPADIIPDLSGGFNPQGDKSIPHPGVRESDYAESASDSGNFVGRVFESPQNPPEWEEVEFARPEYTGTVTSTPSGALVFDAFERRDVVHSWDNALALGTAPTGQVWAGDGNFGILDGCAYLGAVGDIHFARIDCGTADHDIRVTRRVADNNFPAVTIRYVDNNNYIAAFINAAAPIYVDVYKKVGGTLTALGSSINIGTAWTALRMTADGDQISIYNVGNPTALATYTVSDTELQSSTKAGFGGNLSGEAVFCFVDKVEIRAV